MKTTEELNAIKEEVETLNRKLAELTDDELAEVTAGAMIVNHNMAATNTEVDRAAIQKEIDASVQQIDDNARLTFNGKFLNNGARTCQGAATKN